MSFPHLHTLYALCAMPRVLTFSICTREDVGLRITTMGVETHKYTAEVQNALRLRIAALAFVTWRVPMSDDIGSVITSDDICNVALTVCVLSLLDTLYYATRGGEKEGEVCMQVMFREIVAAIAING